MAAWGKFVRDQVKLGEDITKENIIKTITRFEQFVPLKIAVSKTLPSSVIDTTLNLPPGENVVTIPAHLVQDQDNDPLEPTEDPSELDSASIPAFLVQTPGYSTRNSNPSSQQNAPSSSTVNNSVKSPSRNQNPVTKKTKLSMTTQLNKIDLLQSLQRDSNQINQEVGAGVRLPRDRSKDHHHLPMKWTLFSSGVVIPNLLHVRLLKYLVFFDGQ